MRTKLIAALAALFLAAGAGAAFADDFGSGTSEPRDGNNEQTNQVDCGASTGDELVGQDDVGDTGLTLRADSDGEASGYVVLCNDDDSLPIQGRIYGQGDAGSQEGSACADGDADNVYEGDDTATGWACLGDNNGDDVPDIYCMEEDGSSNSAEPTGNESIEDCLPEQ